MVVFKKNLVDIKVQKNRRFLKSLQNKIKFGDYALLALKETKIEMVQLSYIKKFFKKLIKRKKKDKNSKNFLQKNYKIWVSLLPNYVISKKSKNSRMGKGKGSFTRWVVRIRQGYTLAEFLGVPKYRILKILTKFNKKFSMKLCLVSNLKLNCNFPLWSKLNLSTEYFNKYRFM